MLKPACFVQAMGHFYIRSCLWLSFPSSLISNTLSLHPFKTSTPTDKPQAEVKTNKSKKTSPSQSYRLRRTCWYTHVLHMNLAAHALHHPNAICEALLSDFLSLFPLPCFFKTILLGLRKREDGQSSTEISIDHLDSRFSCHRLVTHSIPWDWDKWVFLDHICLQILAATSHQCVTPLRGNIWHVLDCDWRTHFHGIIHKKINRHSLFSKPSGEAAPVGCIFLYFHIPASPCFHSAKDFFLSHALTSPAKKKVNERGSMWVMHDSFKIYHIWG